ncbi:MAG: Ig-like domain-containing protein [Deltaproteobacteria bacterium]|nr:Ig-like domain-containing protein [Deltaproteobacteria bacterium]
MRTTTPCFLTLALAACSSGSDSAIVASQDLASISVTPEQSEVAVGGTAALTATARAGNGATLSGVEVTWSSLDASVATVSASGLVTGVAPGETTIRATSGDVSGQATVRVRDTFALVVTLAGEGSGVVSSTPAGIACGATCEADFAIGSTVALAAEPAADSELAGWSGACVGAASCSVDMDQDQAVTATFRKRPVLTVAVTGEGSVRSTPAGIVCGASGGTCSAPFSTGTLVTLEVEEASGHAFAAWGGACAGDEPTCAFNVTAATTVSATFAPWPTLTVTPTGPGRVTSQPNGIDCRATGGTCSASFSPKLTVKLTATPDEGQLFSGWGGDCSATADAPCQLGMTQSRTATATFAVGRTVVVTTTGPGRVTSSPAGIDCDAAAAGAAGCRHVFPDATQVTLTASPDEGDAFDGWGGDCTGAGACGWTLDANKAVSATFLEGLPVGVTLAGTGRGSVTSAPAGIACTRDAAGTSGTCDARFTGGSTVVLTAAPAQGSLWSGWTGCPAPSDMTCTLTVAGGESVTASFTLDRPRLTVTPVGWGYVTSDPSGINGCTESSGTCQAQFDFDKVVTLTQSPGFTYFVGWTGACEGRGACSVTMSEDRAVGAQFMTFDLTIPDRDLVHPLSIKAGESRGIDVHANLIHGVGAPIVLSVRGELPSGVTAAFEPATITPSQTSRIVLTAAADAPRIGEYGFYIRGTAGAGQADAFWSEVYLTIEVRPPYGAIGPVGVVLEPGGETALVTETPDRIVRVDVETRENLGTVTSGLGPTPGSLVLEAGGETALVASGANLWRVDVATGVKTRIPTPTTGVVLAAARGIALKDATTAIVTDCEADDCAKGRVLSVDLGTGAATHLNAGSYLKAPAAVAVEASGATALVAARDAGRLVRVNLTSGNVSIVATDLPRVEGVAIEAGGATALVSYGPFTARVHLARGTHEQLVAVSNTCCNIPALADVALEAGGASALVADRRPFGATEQFGGRVVRFETSSPLTMLAPGRLADDALFEPSAVVATSATTALVADCGGTSCSTSGRVVEVDLVTGNVTPLTTAGLDTPRAMVLEAAGTALVTERGAGRLLRLDPETGGLTTVASGLTRNGGGPEGVALEPGGATALVGAGDLLLRVTLASGAVTTVASISNTCCGAPGVTGVAVSPDGSFALVLDQGPYATGPSGRLVKLGLDGTPSQILAVRGFVKPMAVTFGESVDVAYVTEEGQPANGRVLRVDLTNGSTTVVSGDLGLPRGIALEDGGPSLLVTDAATDPAAGGHRLVRVTPDLDLAPATRIQGLRYAGGMTIEPDGASALVVDCGDQINGCLTDGRLVRVDLDTLETTVLYPTGPTGLNQPSGVVAESATTALVTHCGPSNGDCTTDSRLVRVTHTPSASISTISSGYNRLAAIRWDSPTSVIGIENRTRIVRIDVEDGSFELLASGFYEGESLEPEPDGKHALLCNANRVSRVDLATGAMTVVVDVPSVPWPAATFDADGHVLLVGLESSHGPPGVWYARVHPTTGGITIHTTGLFTQARQLLLAPDGESALVLERQPVSSAILRVPVP